MPEVNTAFRDHVTGTRPARCHQHTRAYRAGCTTCATWSRWYNQQHRHRTRTGHRTHKTPITQIRQHITTLRAAGMRLADIAADAHMETGALNNITSATCYQWVKPATAHAILNIQPRPVDRAIIDATGTRRRVHALNAIGWTQHDLATHLNVVTSAVGKWCAGQRVHRHTAERVRDLYEQLSTQPGTSTRTAGRARRWGWQPPEAWDDTTIDDPTAHPYQWCTDLVDEVAVELALAGQRVKLTVPEQHAVARTIHRRGGTPTELARAINRSWDYATTLLTRIRAESEAAA